ncbi:hypothetical protein EG328_005492 [Venturia inaequalis]|uniref:Uncharacterized protein n=1 Tax=Venturia inaequalis TaxID=5025 RepID=A0A8H3YS69_VENIN|nr:hypothetical protein EG328_005492 [Venturia inaequalis]
MSFAAQRNSLHIVNEHFTKYPQDAERVVLFIKDGLKPGQPAPDGSEAIVQRSIDECLRVLDGKMSLDLSECARVVQNTPIETTISAINDYVKAASLATYPYDMQKTVPRFQGVAFYENIKLVEEFEKVGR